MWWRVAPLVLMLPVVWSAATAHLILEDWSAAGELENMLDGASRHAMFIELSRQQFVVLTLALLPLGISYLVLRRALALRWTAAAILVASAALFALGWARDMFAYYDEAHLFNGSGGEYRAQFDTFIFIWMVRTFLMGAGLAMGSGFVWLVKRVLRTV